MNIEVFAKVWRRTIEMIMLEQNLNKNFECSSLKDRIVKSTFNIPDTTYLLTFLPF